MKSRKEREGRKDPLLPTRESATKAILEEKHIDPRFPKEVEAAAARIPDRVTEQDLEGREDLREEDIFTIDGDHSKDFDDGVSLTRQEDGTVILGVHIADVGHYVKQGSLLDREAFDRGTSVYYADQVAPMLPISLSNGICSLNPGVDRLTLSCFMTVDQGGDVKEYRLSRSVIRSCERMTYRMCNLLLSGEAGAQLEERYARILPALKGLAELNGVLTAKRRRRGALDLETGERQILCDQEGRPVEVCQRETGVSEQIIESMMLLANETVAGHLARRGLPGVYRVHEAPSEEKCNALRRMLAPFGYEVKSAGQKGFQSLLKKSKGTPEEILVNMLVLRTMMKAAYSPENLGHFGLAAEDYCHFTSPIRRYPDLMVNRVLTAELTGKTGETALRRLTNSCKTAAIQSSEREIAAMTAEREIEKLYLAEYMEGHVGEAFLGMVTGVTSFGLFLTLPNGVDGLLPVRALPDDYYLFDEDHMALIGERTGVRYAFGMTLPVLCAAAHGGLGQVDLALLDEEGNIVPLRERTTRPQGRGKEKNSAQRVIERNRKKGRYRPPKRGPKGKRR